jgi:hypothetical protein
VISLKELPVANQLVKNVDPQATEGDIKLDIDFKKFSHAVLEEVMRRMQKKDA